MGAALGLVVASVPMAVVAVLVRRSLGSPILFKHVRAGRDGHPFTMLKFRTMQPEGVGPLDSADDARRVTPLGRRLRASSLDELPQLWNVLRGDMSLVGPRPLLLDYLDRYTPEQHRRHDVRPGLTGLAQVEGRNGLGWDERLAIDVRYVDTWTLPGDLAILARTVGVVLRRSGVSAAGHASMPRFAGSGR